MKPKCSHCCIYAQFMVNGVLVCDHHVGLVIRSVLLMEQALDVKMVGRTPGEFRGVF